MESVEEMGIIVRMRRNNQIKSKCSTTVYWTSNFHFHPKQPTIYTQTYYYEPADFCVIIVAFIPRGCGTEKQKEWSPKSLCICVFLWSCSGLWLESAAAAWCSGVRVCQGGDPTSGWEAPSSWSPVPPPICCPPPWRHRGFHPWGRTSWLLRIGGVLRN